MLMVLYRQLVLVYKVSFVEMSIAIPLNGTGYPLGGLK